MQSFWISVAGNSARVSRSCAGRATTRRFSAFRHVTRPRQSAIRSLRHDQPIRRQVTAATQATSESATTEERKPWRPAPHRNPDEPVYEMYFTCNVCKHRSGHTISKQGYHKGTTLVKCPGCSNRHLISDHLKIFSDKSITVEQILAEKGEAIEKGAVDDGGDLEFWEDKAVKGSKT